LDDLNLLLSFLNFSEHKLLVFFNQFTLLRYLLLYSELVGCKLRLDGSAQLFG
jgi:hypothetical protein